MKLEKEYFQIEDVNFNNQIQILLKHNQTNLLAIDYYSQCLISSLKKTNQECSLCLKEIFSRNFIFRC
ncbi:unnamed protein product [Paramecium primaurelia]|uniref:Uncharacterized protein n=1 Tax=Paramecium primaurelia TaxID=5886 RepID=A0A8S1MQC0_PARPR|nr:unnamed protein product [Paramecium primaurelia]